MNSNLAQNSNLIQANLEESNGSAPLGETITSQSLTNQSLTNQSLSSVPELFRIVNSDQIQAEALASSNTFSFPGKEILVLASVLALLQIADGVLTGVGVYHMGIDMEANPLLRLLMDLFGTAPTLIAAKGLALIVITLLASLSQIVPWITIAFRGMVALYAFVAVLPWSAILYGYFSA